MFRSTRARLTGSAAIALAAVGVPAVPATAGTAETAPADCPGSYVCFYSEPGYRGSVQSRHSLVLLNGRVDFDSVGSVYNNSAWTVVHGERMILLGCSEEGTVEPYSGVTDMRSVGEVCFRI
ncbi:peptidase inhibitor family I36 protein [Streptomyces sp. TRM 70361]|uniref:peptidase inhibitor family I36 protein n=1 Tax=Streptomyces sp. TRM 70361 TaxID=3116553 RepID=UPI002E7AF823|nr:peptidase inhibitor family I36 protein [Streptomyces sp. TRM 70361]MEE1942154.1 peptidase inhibitor family I36 protein [Streptomyces sp. TRM 70361]